MAMSSTCRCIGTSSSMFARIRHSGRPFRDQIKALSGVTSFGLAALIPGVALATEDCTQGTSPPHKLTWTILIVLVGGGIRLAIHLRRMPGGYFARHVLPYVLAVAAVILALLIVGFIGLTGLCLPDEW